MFLGRLRKKIQRGLAIRFGEFAEDPAAPTERLPVVIGRRLVSVDGRSTGASLVLAVLTVVGVEAVRRMVRSDVSDGRTRH